MCHQGRVKTAFQRARSPAQKAERAEAILAAARAWLAESLDSSALSLGELARRAGMAKSNVYRYFESRESVLLSLLTDEGRAWADAARRGLGALQVGDAVDERLEAMARVLAQATARRPLLCHLLSVLPSVLEHNVEYETVREFKAQSVRMVEGLACAMHAFFPPLSAAQHAELLHHALALIVGGWPLSHPSATVERVMADHPAFEGFRHRFEADLRRAFVLMTRGLLAEVGPAR